MVSTNCAAQRRSAPQALAGIAIATMTSLRHRPTKDSGTDIASLVRRSLAGVYTPSASTPCLKNVSPLACYNFDAHEWILIFFGRNVTDKVGNQTTLYYATSTGTHKNHILHSIGLCYTHNARVRCLPEKMSSVMCFIASNIC